jgi:hypothetical protein
MASRPPKKVPAAQTWQLLDEGTPTVIFLTSVSFYSSRPWYVPYVQQLLTQEGYACIWQSAYCEGPGSDTIYYEDISVVAGMTETEALNVAQSFQFPAFLVRDRHQFALIDSANGRVLEFFAWQSELEREILPISAQLLLKGYRRLLEAHYYHLRELRILLEIHPDASGVHTASTLDKAPFSHKTISVFD